MIINKEKLQEILRLHLLWLDDKVGGIRANLSGADLSGADLTEANLTEANLRGADLTGATLSGADLLGADLLGANLRRADLRRANLTEANLQVADLRRADLRRADLTRVSLRRADLRGANLDYSCWPLWCGSKGVKVDAKIYKQLLGHILILDVDDLECKSHQNNTCNTQLASDGHRWEDLMR